MYTPIRQWIFATFGQRFCPIQKMSRPVPLSRRNPPPQKPPRAEDLDEDDHSIGTASDDEPDNVLEDFRCEPDADEEDADELFDSDCDVEEPSSKVRVLDVPNILQGRDGIFKWTGKKPTRTRRIPQRNILLHPSGNLHEAKGPTDELALCYTRM